MSKQFLNSLRLIFAFVDLVSIPLWWIVSIAVTFEFCFYGCSKTTALLVRLPQLVILVGIGLLVWTILEISKRKETFPVVNAIYSAIVVIGVVIVILN